MREVLTSFCAAVILIGGCPKRQPTPRIVYVPARAPATAPEPATPTETMVIEEPPPPEAEPKPSGTSQESTAPKPIPRRRRPPARADAPAEAEEQPVEPPPLEVPAPALEPQETIEQQAKSRSAIVIAQDGIQKRIADLSTARLAAADRKTLDDARGFLAQSRRALETDDLQRAGLLARKASLLVSAVEQSH